MANTRTLLAWIRTSVALIGLGFVVARFGLFLRALDAQAGRGGGAPALSGAIGVGLVLIGVLVAVLSLRRFRQIERAWPIPARYRGRADHGCSDNPGRNRSCCVSPANEIASHAKGRMRLARRW